MTVPALEVVIACVIASLGLLVFVILLVAAVVDLYRSFALGRQRARRRGYLTIGPRSRGRLP